MMRTGMLLRGVLLRGLVFVLPLSACAVQPESAPQPVPTAYFGMHIHRAVQTQPWLPHGDKLTPWPGVNFGSWRLWDAYVSWPSLEPEKGRWNFTTLDKYVSMAKLAGVELVLPLGLTPTWASARPHEPSGYRPGNAAEPRHIEDWRNYVRTVGQRYKGRIRVYELWNEVNIKTFYSGSQESLLVLARVAYETLKSIDPECLVVSPSVVGGGRHLKWFSDYLEMGGGGYADAISYHFYVPKDAPEAMVPLIRQVKTIMRAHNLTGKRLWNTETGWWIDNQPGLPRIKAAGADWRKLDDNMAAAYVARALILGRAEELDRFYWYAWDNIDMGLIEPGTLKLRPAATAFNTVARWLSGNIVKPCERDKDIWICPMDLGSSGQAWLIWSESDKGNGWRVPVDWRISLIKRLDGGAHDLVNDAVSVGPEPIMLIPVGNREK